MLKWCIAVAFVVAPLMVMAQADKPPDPKELAAVERIRARIEEQVEENTSGPTGHIQGHDSEHDGQHTRMAASAGGRVHDGIRRHRLRSLTSNRCTRSK